jgi:molybdopterin synthase sulfur carrier subunit
MKVFIPSPLRSYTDKKNVVEGEGTTLAELLADLDRRFPGIRFRIVDEQDQIRPHFKFFVNQSIAPDLATSLQPEDEVRIIAAISGG